MNNYCVWNKRTMISNVFKHTFRFFNAMQMQEWIYNFNWKFCCVCFYSA
jgi:hypothetical protein